MAPLSPAEVKRWDVGAIDAVFETASGRAASLQRLGDHLGQVNSVLADWHGEAGEAFRGELGKVRGDIEADGQESRRVAAAVSRAEADVRACKAELEDVERTAAGYGWTITPDWRIDLADTGIGIDPIGFAAEQQVVQDALNACRAHAHNADQELAFAIRAAVGEAEPDASATPPGGGPHSLQDMLVPAGGGAAGAEGGMPASLEDMLLGRDQPAGAGEPDPGSLPDLLSGLPQLGVGLPGPSLKPVDVEAFKAMARETMARDGVPPDQNEEQLNDVVDKAHQWVDNGMPAYVAPKPPRQPPPGFGEAFGDRWFGFEQQVKDLTGQDGLQALGDSWGGVAKGLLGKAGESIVGPVAAVNDLTHEMQHVADSPSLAYYAGEKAADGAIALPGMLFGGEGAGLGELTDVAPDAVYDGLKPLPHSPIGLDGQTPYHPWSSSMAQDLYSAFVHGEPTAPFGQQLADLATHYIGDNPDRLVLGKWDGQDGGYIGEARANGGIYFDTGDPTWDAMTYGLSDTQQRALAWQVNEHVLRSQMEVGVPRIEFSLPQEFTSVEQLAATQRRSFSALEINFLKENAETYGYVQHGNVWVREGSHAP